MPANGHNPDLTCWHKSRYVNPCKVTNGGCPTYDKDVAHLIRLPLADRVAAFFRFGPRDRGWWCGRCGAPPASS